MQINQLKDVPATVSNQKLLKKHEAFKKLIFELQKREIPISILAVINKEVEKINVSLVAEKDFLKQMRKSKSKILSLVEKELKLVTRNHYRNLWLVLGMSAFGLPLGVVFGFAVDNIGLMGIGLPLGMVIGMAVGTAMDKKAKEQGRQLDVEMNF
ncbi:hypothetical protein GCM10011506_24230 [Marivirga lumbricoides]|uniref:Glycine zipper family protein n=1 Tax=Marivirga lumbricoides TaxID=1046115 RepID=A0ABQ1MBI2_9BACT|nr:hypothetical protein GCM10011506_24230 [Marivirga lumbricoides]